MKILFIAHRFPYPPTRGDKIRAFSIIRHLANKHEVTVASLARTAEEAKEGEGIAPYCKKFIMERVHNPLQVARMIKRLPVQEPSSMGFFLSRKLKRRIDEELSRQRFDLIFVYCSSVAQYVEDVKGIPKILDFVDMDSQKWLSYGLIKPFPLKYGYFLEGLKMQLAEVSLADKFDLCTTATAAEMRTLQGLRPGVSADWFPNGVDAERFSPSEEPYDPDEIVFVGRMDYYPNQECMFEFCDNTLPLIQKKRPGAKLTIVGAEPPAEVRALGKRKGVTVTGSVDQVQPYIKKAALTVAPLNIARGTQNKILESLAMGVPCVCSTLAAGGVDAVEGEHLLAANRPDEYAQKVLRLLSNPDERARMGVAGRKRMLSNHSWDSAMNRMDDIIEALMERERAVQQIS